MKIAELLLPEFDQEMATTRRVLEASPVEPADWKPHERSMEMGYLIALVAMMPHWTTLMLDRTSWDIASGEDSPTLLKDTAEVLALFDENAARARKLLAATDDTAFMEDWTFLNDGNALFTMPRYSAYRGFVLNHLVHHRAQLGVYLRLRDIPVPAMYGPSADEAPPEMEMAPEAGG